MQDDSEGFRSSARFDTAGEVSSSAQVCHD